MIDAIQLRQPQPSDHDVIAALLTRAYPLEPVISAETVAWSYDRADAQRPQASLVADLDGTIIGSGFVRGIPSMAGLLLNVEVEPERRRRGIGSRLLAALLDGIGATELIVWTMVSEADTGSLEFMEHHGFVERDRMFESTLDLPSFEPDAFADGRASVVEHGIRFTRFSDEDSAELRRQLHELTTALNRDVPTTVSLIAASYEDWVNSWLEAPHSRPDLLVVAFDGDRPVALSSIAVAPDGIAFNHMSGVAPSHRGQGLGLAVKVEALRLAKEAGITEIRTDNHVRNAPMLAINARLGYQRLPGYIELARANG